MFELRDGPNYSMYNNINENSFDWKIEKSVLETNEHDLLELKFNTSKAVLLGSSDSVFKVPEVINRY